MATSTTSSELLAKRAVITASMPCTTGSTKRVCFCVGLESTASMSESITIVVGVVGR